MSHQHIHVRRMKLTEINEVLRLWSDLHDIYVEYDPWYATVSNASLYIRRYLANSIGSRKRIVLVALGPSKNVIGFLHLLHEIRPPIFVHKNVVRVLDICVDQEWRYAQKGVDVGVLLIRHCCRFAKQKKASYIVAHIAQKNQRAKTSFWEHNSFKSVSNCLIRLVEV